MPRGARLWLVGAVALAAVAVVVWLAFGRTRPMPTAPVARDDGTLGARRADTLADPTAPAQARRPALPSPAAEADAPDAPDGPGGESEEATEPDDDAMAAMWATVDMDAVRQAMPNNLYWKLGVPTQDQAVIDERDAERARWNVEYGKVLSGTASEEEIRTYYDYRARVSGDYVEFATYLIDHYQESLPERDVALLQLARRLNLARLEEIPRKVEEAFDRKRKQDAARAQWLADQKVFGDAEPRPEGE